MRPSTALKLLRALPSIAIAGLLVFGLLGATAPDAPRTVPAAMVYPNCTSILQAAPGESAFVLVYGEGVIQPFGFAGNVAACSLAVGVNPWDWVVGTFQLQSWDPTALAPDPSTVALRSNSFSTSMYAYWLRRFDFVPPVVLKTLPSVAEPQRTTAAIRYTRFQYSAGQTMHYTPAAAASVPAAMRVPGPGAPVPLAGTHGAISHTVCGGDQALQDLAVCQSVVHADTMFGNDVHTIVQRFRVPVWTQLYWVELAFGYVTTANPQGYLPGSIAILDAQGQAQPPVTPDGALTAASFNNYTEPAYPAWQSHYDFDRSIVLQPHHDYWLYVQPVLDYGLYARRLTGTEGPAFTSGIGECWTSNVSPAQWRSRPQSALDFKIVGLPIGLLDAPAPAPVASALHLSARPNPSRGATVIAWAGARGALRFEVIDPRGRRGAGGEGNANAAGEWLFRGARDDGRPLPAGVYFVRAVDAAGQSAVERVVLVR
jgi:hypothetical protein